MANRPDGICPLESPSVGEAGGPDARRTIWMMSPAGSSPRHTVRLRFVALVNARRTRPAGRADADDCRSPGGLFGVGWSMLEPIDVRPPGDRCDVPGDMDEPDSKAIASPLSRLLASGLTWDGADSS